jgi:predicted RNA binding protein YcfA (HicA-like mRNA interferase family)
LDRQSGSHATLIDADAGRSATVPIHGARDVPRGTLRRIIRDAGLTVEEFRQLLK